MSEDLYRKDGDEREQVLSKADWPLLFSCAKGDSGPTVWDELKKGRFSDVELEMPWGFDDREMEGSEQYTLAQLPGLFMDEAGDYIRALHHFMFGRFVKGKLAPRQGEKGGHIADIPGHVSACELIDLFASCLDLRGLCADPCVLPQRDDALTAIVERASASGMRFDVSDGAPSLHEQLEELRSRLSAAAKEYPYSDRWFVEKEDGSREIKSGTVIMADLFKVEALHTGLGDILYVYNHAVLHIFNEAVVEGMGSMLSMHGDKTRGRLRQELTEIEALVHYNFPPLSHPASETIIREVLNHHFGVDTSGRQKPWHFTQRSSNGQNSLFASRSKVLRRQDAAPAKHAFMAQ